MRFRDRRAARASAPSAPNISRRGAPCAGASDSPNADLRRPSQLDRQATVDAGACTRAPARRHARARGFAPRSASLPPRLLKTAPERFVDQADDQRVQGEVFDGGEIVQRRLKVSRNVKTGAFLRGLWRGRFCPICQVRDPLGSGFANLSPWRFPRRRGFRFRAHVSPVAGSGYCRRSTHTHVTKGQALGSARGAVGNRERVFQLHAVASWTELDNEVRIVAAKVIAAERCDFLNHRHLLHGLKFYPGRRPFTEIFDAHVWATSCTP